MLPVIETKVWVSTAVAFLEAPCNGSLRSAVTACNAGAGFASSQIPLLCPYHYNLRPTRDGSSARAYTQESLGEAPQILHSSEEDGFVGDPLTEGYKGVVYREDDGEAAAFANPHSFQAAVEVVHKYSGDAVHTESLASDMDGPYGNKSPKIQLRLDALDMQRDFRGRPFRPRLDVDSPPPKHPSKAGKRQNVPPHARQMILELRDFRAEDFAPTLRRLKSLNPERADWLYVLRYFREKEDKSMLLEVFNFALLQPAFESSVRDYTNLIRVFIELKDHKAVEYTLKTMVEREVFPDLLTFTVVIGMYGKLGNFDMVNSKFDQLKLYGLVPDTIIYSATIEAYSQVGYAREAESFLEVMERAELPLKIEIFISLIRGYGNIGQVEDAERMFQLMQAKLFYPERRSYSALMDAYTKDEDVEHAIQVFNNMVAVGIEPTDKSLARLMLACEKKNMLQEAVEIMQKLEIKSFKLGTNLLISFSGWLSKLRLDKEVALMSTEVEKRLNRKAALEKKWNAYLPASYQT